jgi:hypothetical protein
MDQSEIGSEHLNWIKLAQDLIQLNLSAAVAKHTGSIITRDYYYYCCCCYYFHTMLQIICHEPGSNLVPEAHCKVTSGKYI